MSDNVTQFDRDNHPQGLFRRILTISLLTVVVLGVLALVLFPEELNLDAMRRWFRYLNVRDDSSYGEYTFDAHNRNCYAQTADGLSVASVGGLYLYGPEGTELTSSQAQITLPVILSRGDYSMTYDAGGSTLLLAHAENGELLRLEPAATFYDADLSSDGAVCVAAAEGGHKTVLSVYDSDQALIYRWLSSSAFMPVCAVSKSAGCIAAVGLGQNDNVFESKLYLFDSSSEQPKNSVSLGNELIYDMNFPTDHLICMVGEASVCFVNTAGELVGRYSYEGQYLKSHDFGGNGFLTLILNMYKAGNRYTIQTVNQSGEQIASLYLGQEILDVSAAGKYVAVLTSEQLTIYTEHLNVYAQTEETGMATNVVMRDDGTAILLGNGSGHLYIP